MESESAFGYLTGGRALPRGRPPVEEPSLPVHSGSSATKPLRPWL